MLKVLLDTNVLIDMAGAERAHHASARRLLDLAVSNRIHVVVPACLLKDFYYIMLGFAEEAAVRSFIRAFMTAFDIVSLDMAACQKAIDSDEPDFEDGIVRAIAEGEAVDFLVTEDADAYVSSAAPKATAEEVLSMMGLDVS